MAPTASCISLVDDCKGLFGRIGGREVIDGQSLGGNGVCSGATGLEVALDLEGAEVHAGDWMGGVSVGRLSYTTAST